MQRTYPTYLLIFLFCHLLCLPAAAVQAENGDDVLARTIRMPKSKNTVYQLLGEISERTGFLFIYDSHLIDNEKNVRIPKGDYTIRQAIYQITGNDKLQLQVIGNHILISLPKEKPIVITPDTVIRKEIDQHLLLQGVLHDRFSNTPIDAGTIGVMNTSIGTISNANGEFRLTLPDSLRNSSLYFSHVGYESQQIEIVTLMGTHATISLEPKVIPIQEVVVRIINPLRLLREMKEKMQTNYLQTPAYLTTFYREGVERKNSFVSLTEAVFKVYKPAYKNDSKTDQVKLLKMRRISSNEARDTIVTKMKSGINASLMLDIMKDMPDFLQPDEYPNLYTYVSTDITVIDGRLANVIYFEQQDKIKEPLYQGELFIDSENSALLRARFEIQPKYVAKTAGMLVEKKSRNLKITPQKVIYTVSYKSWNGQYYISHVRGDLYFRIKKRKQLFSGFPLHTWFEMVTGKMETQQVNRFTRNETLSTRTVFAETKFTYDSDFWGNFNYILPEEQLNEAIGKISAKIEETGD